MQINTGKILIRSCTGLIIRYCAIRACMKLWLPQKKRASFRNTILPGLNYYRPIFTGQYSYKTILASWLIAVPSMGESVHNRASWRLRNDAQRLIKHQSAYRRLLLNVGEPQRTPTIPVLGYLYPSTAHHPLQSIITFSLSQQKYQTNS